MLSWFISEPTNNLPPKIVGEPMPWRIATFSLHADGVILCPVVGYPNPVFK